MNLTTIDWAFVAAFFIFSLFIGILVARKAGSSASEYFLSGRNMPWWLLGVSMVATTFSSDTPNLVTDIVRRNGVSGNWEWWAFLLTGMLTVFVYAKLWRRSGVLTDVEFYEIRYSGRPAAFLRGFRAIYLGFFFNVMVMASVTLSAIKISGVLLGLPPVQTLLIASSVTVIYSALGGLRGVMITDFFQFFIAMIGSIWAAIYITNLPEVGGLEGLLTHPQLSGKLSLIPDFSETDLIISVFIIPIAVQWWSVWYPGSEPGGGGYVVQRILSSKDEKNAMGATLFFNAAHYALRPWPWIIIALASLVVFPNISDPNAEVGTLAARGLEPLREAFPNLPENIIGHDMAYPAMLSYLPSGLLGLVIASLIAAYMSTISTQLNWGASYIVNDYYKRFLKPDASEKELVNIGRLMTVMLMVFSALLALLLQSALDTFKIILQIGAGTGLIFILRWFWWRVNAWSEITAMLVSFIVAIYFQLIHTDLLGLAPLASHIQLILGVVITSIAWLAVAYYGKPTSTETLENFYTKIKPEGPGWKAVREKIAKDKGSTANEGAEWGQLPLEILCMVIGCFTVYGALFATGFWIYGNIFPAVFLTIVTLAGTYFIFRIWGRLKTI